MRFESIIDAIGHTPLVRLNRITDGIKCKVYAKLEFLNPGGSVKDRIGRSMVEDALKKGTLKPGGTIVEGTSGNTGAGLAIVGGYMGYRCVFTVNDKQSKEKIDMLRAFGAQVIVCPTAVPPEDSRHYTQVAKKLCEEIQDAIYMNQYDNPANIEAHYRTTGPELWEETEGKITHFVCGMGTCGTITGVGRFLKEKNPKVKVIGIDPIGSIFHDLFYKGVWPEARVYKTEGIGEDFLPRCTDFSVIDEIIQVTDRDAFIAARKLVRREGIFGGGSSGSAIWGSLKLARELPAESLVVVLLPDGGMRYLAKVYNDNWMQENQFNEEEAQVTAADILKHKPIVQILTAAPRQPLMEILKLMQDKDISQMPVIESGGIVGTVYDDDIMQCVISGKDLMKSFVAEVMKPPLPVLPKTATITQISQFIPSKFQAVLIEEGPKNFQVITKYDLLHAAANLSREK